MKLRFFLKGLLKPSIRRRLAFGYLLTIGIAAVGIQAGQRWAYLRVRDPAQQQLEYSYKHSNHLNELQKSFLDTKALILAYIQRPGLLGSYKYHLTTRSQQLQALLDDLETEYILDLQQEASKSSDHVRTSFQTEAEKEDLNDFLADCKDAGRNYERALQDLFNSIEIKLVESTDVAKGATSEEIEESQLPAQAVSSALVTETSADVLAAIADIQPNSDIESQREPTSLTTNDSSTVSAASAYANNRAVQVELLSFIGLEPAERLDRCAIALDSLTFHNRANILQASFQLEEAIRLQSQITNLTLLLSLIAAIGIALYSSWSITRPLTNVSKVAQQVSQNSNFDIQIPVESRDEVGVLSSTLNNLIHRVRLLLKEQKETQQKLESYNQTLESAVQTRSKEILEKNSRLEQMLEDLHEAQSQLVQAEKMSSLGQLVAGIAHEINNPVNFIHGNIQYASNYFDDILSLVELYQSDADAALIQQKTEEVELDFLVEDFSKLLSSMKMGTERIREIVLSLRNFSRLDESDLKTADLHEGIDSTLLILGHRIKASDKYPEIEVVKYYSDIPLVECFPGQLNQVFMNIIANAIDAFEGATIRNPQITISTAQIDNRVKVTISDNGSGIPQNVRERIFEPFFTTKDVGKGTGMGLSISYKIITEKHNGQIVCESKEGKGTTFIIELPIKR